MTANTVFDSPGLQNSPIAFQYEYVYGDFVSGKTDVWQGTLALMVLKTLACKGPLHGYGIARQIEATSADVLFAQPDWP
jgi:hypothetical protein